VKRKRICENPRENETKSKGGGLRDFDFSIEIEFRKVGAAQSPKIYNIFCDISLITKKSNGLVSHFSYIRILLRVISKGRDKIVEIGSSSLLSHKCK
jgi:hypothetical protein